MFNLNYAPTNLGVQSWRDIICGGTRTKKLNTTVLGYDSVSRGIGFRLLEGLYFFVFRCQSFRTSSNLEDKEPSYEVFGSNYPLTQGHVLEERNRQLHHWENLQTVVSESGHTSLQILGISAWRVGIIKRKMIFEIV
jgi:hypothetical protein